MRVSIVTVALVLAAAPAFAALGGDASSIDADRVHVQGALVGIQRLDTHAVHEIQSATGTTIREYLAPNGTVFAVSWNGPFMPDLRQVLGTYFDAYQRLARARRGHGPLNLTDGDFVVQVAGHMRSFSGRAYVGRLTPSGVQPAQLR